MPKNTALSVLLHFAAQFRYMAEIDMTDRHGTDVYKAVKIGHRFDPEPSVQVGNKNEPIRARWGSPTIDAREGP